MTNSKKTNDSKKSNDIAQSASQKKTSKVTASKKTSSVTKSKSMPVESEKVSQAKPTPAAKPTSTAQKTTKAKSTMEKPTSESSTSMTQPSAHATEKKSSNSASIFAVIFSLAALAGVALTWYQSQVTDVRSESGLAVGITEIGGQVSRISDSVTRLQEQQSNIVSEDKLNASLQQTSLTIEKRLEQFDEKFQQVDGAQAQLTESVTTLSNDLKSGSNAYVIDEVAQLLKLANNSLVFASDPDSALNALTVAAGQLKSITDPRYSTVRVKIAEEIALLKNIQPIDIEGISASLNAISASVPSLPLENEPESTQIEFSEQEQEEKLGWRAELAKLGNDIANSIQVHKVENAPKPLLAPEQRYFLDQNLQLTLAQAGLALLQERDAVFQQSIDSASKWLLDYFDTKNPEVTNVLSQLSQIRDQKISVELPTITGSFEQLQAIRGGQ